MKTIEDCFGRRVRLTDERLAHVLAHPEMASMAAEIEKSLRQPELVRRSLSDENVLLFYELYRVTPVGEMAVRDRALY